MTKERPLDDYQDEAIAGRVRQQLSVFPQKFKELGEAGELRKILNSRRTLSGPKVHQAPEDFTEQYLIEPVLHALRYRNPISEEYTGEQPHFVRRPTTFNKIELNRPDYMLKNVSPECVCILEAKAANEEHLDGSKRNATGDVADYIASNTFAKYLQSREKRYLIAIGTDGLRWTLWAKDVRSGEVVEGIQSLDISDKIEGIARKENVIEDGSTRSDVDIRHDLRDEFVPYFSASRILNSVVNHF